MADETVLGKVAIEMNLKDSKFQKQLIGTKQAIKNTMSEMKANMAVMDTAGQKYGMLAAKQAGLQRVLEAQTNRMKALKAEYEGSITKSGEWTRATARYAQQYNIASAKVAQLNKQLIANAKAMAIAKTETTGFIGVLNRFGNGTMKASDALRGFGKKATVVTSPITAGFAYAAKSAIDFNSQIQKLGPLLTNGGAVTSKVRAQLDQMSESSKKWSREYGVSTSAINAGMEEMLKRGYNANQTLGAMPAVLSAAKASGDDFNTVMSVSTATLEQFGLQSQTTNGMMKNTQRVTDTLTYIANGTASGFQDLGEAMTYVGPTAHSAGLSLEETAAALGIMSNKGIEGSVAGTALRSSLTRMLKPSKQNAAAFKEMGINIADFKQGTLTLPGIIDKIRNNTKGWTKEQRAAAIAQAFGTEAQAGINALISAGGDELRKYTEGAKNAGGTTKSIADQMNNTDQAKIERFKQSLHVLAIEVGQKLLPALTPIVDKASNFIEAFSKMGDGMQKFVIYSALTAAAIGPLSYVLGSIIRPLGLLSQGTVKVVGFFRAWQAGKAALNGAQTDMTALGTGATTASTGVEVATTALKIFNPYVLGTLTTVGLAVGVYELWGKKAIESADITSRWGTDIGHDADQAASSFKSFQTQATVALDDTSSNAQKNAKEIDKAFKGMSESAEGAAKKQKKAADKLADDIGGEYGQVVREQAAKQDSENQKHIKKMQEYANQVKNITKKSRDDNVALTQDQKNTISNLQRKMAQEEVETLNISSKQKKLVLKAQLNETNGMTKKQLQAMTEATEDAMYKEVDKYNEAYGKIKRNTQLSAQEKNAILEEIEKKHNSTMSSLEEAFIASEKARGNTKAGILEDWVEKTGMSMSQAKKIYAQWEEAQKQAEATSIKITGKMSEDVQKAASDWNGIILDPKTGNLKTNAQEEINKAVNSSEKWAEIELLEKKGVLSTNAEQMVAAALIANNRWDQLSWEEKTAWLKDGFSETIVKALEESGKWNVLSLEQKEAIVTAKGEGDMAKLMIQFGLWDGLSLKEQELLIEDKATRTVYDALKSSGEWNKLTIQQKQAVVTAKGNQDLVNTLFAIGKWNSLSPKEQRALIKSQGGADLVQALNDMGKWNALSPKKQNAIINSKGGNDLNQLITDYNLWQGMPLSVVKQIVADDQASGKLTAANHVLDSWLRANPGPAKTAQAQDFASSVLLGAKNSTDRYRNTSTGGPKNAMANDMATGALNRATRGVNAFRNTSPGGTKNAKASDHASGPAGSAIRAVSAFASLRDHTVNLFTNYITKHIKNARGTAYHPGGAMMVNDSPGQHFRELVQLPNGQSFIPSGRNVVFSAPRGTKVMTANRTSRMFPGLKQYAEGTIQQPQISDNLRFLRVNSLLNFDVPNSTTTVIAGQQTDISRVENQLNQMITLLGQLVVKDSSISLNGQVLSQFVNNAQASAINLEGRGVYSGT